MKIANATILITGANRGIGRALVEAALARGAAKVYAGARQPEGLAFADPRVVPLALDVTDAASVAAAAAAAGDVGLLVNNAGVAEFGDILAPGAAESLRRQAAVNVFGLLAVTQAFVPAVTAAATTGAGGVIVNLLSVVSLAPMAALAPYSVSKAAAHSVTGALRTALKPAGVGVHGVFPGPVDTDMAKDMPMAKAAPIDVANAIYDGVEAGAEDIYPDAMAAGVGAGWAQGPKAIEAAFAAM
ncbi:short-chain dehydrogenase [alpha proteobacterium AAP81b]|nr:short-chain dehydrogenase [alpha proteobacterium AAP81b]